MASSPTFIFSSGSNVIASEANSGTIMSSQVNQNYSEAYCTVNSLNSANFSSAFSLNLSQITLNDSPTICGAGLLTGYFSASVASGVPFEEAINEIGNHWFRLNISTVVCATTINCALSDLASAVTHFQVSASPQRTHILDKPSLYYIPSNSAPLGAIGLVGIDGNASQVDTVRISFPNNRILGICQGSGIALGDNFRFLHLSSTGVYSAGTACAQAGFFGGSYSNNAWYGIYAVGITGTSEFVGMASFLLPTPQGQGGLNTGSLQLDSQFGENNWVYLGLIRTGRNDSNVNALETLDISRILPFVQTGKYTLFLDSAQAGDSVQKGGIKIAHGSTTANLTWSVTKAISGTVIPTTVQMGRVSYHKRAGFFSAGSGIIILEHSQANITSQEITVNPLNNIVTNGVSLWAHFDSTGTIKLIADQTSGSRILVFDGWYDPYV